MSWNVSHSWTQWHGVTAQNTWIFGNSAVRTVNFAACELYERLRVCSIDEQQLASHKGDWSGHEEVKNVWSYTTTPSPIQLHGLVRCAERQFLLCMCVWASDSVWFHSSHIELTWEVKNAWSNTTPPLSYPCNFKAWFFIMQGDLYYAYIFDFGIQFDFIMAIFFLLFVIFYIILDT